MNRATLYLLLQGLCMLSPYATQKASPFTATPAPSTPPATSVPQYQNNVFLEVDFLYWFSKQEGNQYAVTGSALSVPGTDDPNTLTTAGPCKSGNVYELDFEMNPGYKVGGGMNLAHGKWDIFLEYTYLHSNAHGSVKSDNLNSGIIPIFSYTPHKSILSNASYATAADALGFVSHAKSHWSLAFNNINLELGRNVQLATFLSLRPYLGIEGSWQKQHFDTTYYVSSITDFDESLGHNNVTFSQDFWGVGLRTGIDGTWNCWRHLDLFANIATALLWGQFQCKGRSFDTNDILGYEDVSINNQSNNLHSLSPMIALEAGIQSSWSLYSKYLFLVQVGWENQVWFFQNQHSSSIADTSLILEGLTVKMRFDF